MLRTNTLIRPLLAALMVVALLAPAALADSKPPAPAPTYWSYDYQAPIPHPRTAHAAKPGSDTPWAAIAVTLAGVCLVFGAATVLPRRTRQRVAV